MEKEEKGDVARHNDKGGAGKPKRQGGLLGVRLRRGLSIAKRGSLCMPAPARTLEEEEGEEEEEDAGACRTRDCAGTAADGNHYRVLPRQHSGRRPLLPFPAAVTAGTVAADSARKLGANLWEIQESRQHSRMSKRGTRSRYFKGEKLADLSVHSPLVLHDEVKMQALVQASLFCNQTSMLDTLFLVICALRYSSCVFFTGFM